MNMATYTPNYGFHQWEATDNFLRTDFNTDFGKIDASIAKTESEICYRKLRDIVSQSDGTQINLDLDDLDLTGYHFLDIWVIPCPGEGYSATIELLVNHLTEGYRSGEYPLQAFLSAPVGTVPGYFNHLRFRLYLGNFLMASCAYGYFYGNRAQFPDEMRMNSLMLGAEELQSIQITGGSSVPLAAGCRVMVYGLRK